MHKRKGACKDAGDSGKELVFKVQIENSKIDTKLTDWNKN